MDLLVVPAGSGDRAPAVGVWQAANTARGLLPTAQRIARVQTKIHAGDALLVVAHADAEVVAMALAEPARADDGAGQLLAGQGHVSMVFVTPRRWGRGIGTALMSGLHQYAGDRGWHTLSLWTRRSNTAAQRLYAASGYRPTGRTSRLPSGDLIVQLHHE